MLKCRSAALIAALFMAATWSLLQVSATVAAIIKRGWLEGGQAERDAALQGIHAQVGGRWCRCAAAAAAAAA